LPYARKADALARIVLRISQTVKENYLYFLVSRSILWYMRLRSLLSVGRGAGRLARRN
jgi:hypothetical protein